MNTYELESEPVAIATSGVTLHGELVIPEDAVGMVLFAHGSGSSRRSVRNRYVAEVLNEADLGTLLFDLLTSEEEAIDLATRQYRFDIPRLARRLVGAIDWFGRQQIEPELGLGLFGASTGAAAALIAAAHRPHSVSAVVSRGGRPDLADAVLPSVKAPTLMIVGGDDEAVIRLNQRAQRQMHAENQLVIVPGATHLFEEHGKLEEVARLAREWFLKHFS